jgi:3-isopropylmalate dehydrogenase
MGAILSAALLLETTGWIDEARLIERAVEAAVVAGRTTPDVGGSLGTRDVGDWIARRVKNEERSTTN